MFWNSKENKRTAMRERWGKAREDGVGFGLIDKYRVLQPKIYDPYRLN